MPPTNRPARVDVPMLMMRCDDPSGSRQSFRIWQAYYGRRWAVLHAPFPADGGEYEYEVKIDGYKNQSLYKLVVECCAACDPLPLIEELMRNPPSLEARRFAEAGAAMLREPGKKLWRGTHTIK